MELFSERFQSAATEALDDPTQVRRLTTTMLTAVFTTVRYRGGITGVVLYVMPLLLLNRWWYC